MKNVRNLKGLYSFLYLTLSIAVLSGCQLTDSTSEQVKDTDRVDIIIDRIAPDAPASVRVTNVNVQSASSASLVLRWNESEDEGGSGIKRYKIFLNDNLVGTTTGLSYAFGTLVADREYAFAVQAEDRSLNESTLSVLRYTTPEVGSQPDPNQAPSAPTGLQASNISETGFTLSWNAAADAEDGTVDDYKIQLDGVLMPQLISNTQYQFENLSADTVYRMRVVAIDSDGASSVLSAQFSQSTLPSSSEADVTAPSVPTNVVASQVTARTFVLTWAASTDTGGSGVQKYVVKLNGSAVDETTSTSLPLSGLTPSANYRVKVAAVDRSGNVSADSSEIQVPMLAEGSNSRFNTIEIEGESATLSSGWVRETSKAGFSGTGYVRWSSADKIYSYEDATRGCFMRNGSCVPLEVSWLNYMFQVDEPGEYKLVARVRRDTASTDPGPDGSNDVYLQVPNFTPVRKFFPEFPFPWNNWVTVGKVMTSSDEARETLRLNFTQAGSYTLKLAGRSQGFTVDKVYVTNDFEPLSLPRNVRLASRSGNSVRFEWDASVDPEGYPISHYGYYLDDSPVGVAMTNSVTLTNVSASDSRTFRVRVFDHVFNRSSASEIVRLNAPVGTTSGSGDTGGGNTGGGTSGNGTYVSTASFQNIAISPAKTEAFRFEFDVLASSSPIDALVGLSDSPPSPSDIENGFKELAAIVRFSNTGKVDAYNNTGYAAVNTLMHTAQKSYHVVMDIDVPLKKYSVRITPQGGSEVVIASNYLYRTQQADTTSITHISLIALTGTLTMSNLSFSALNGEPLGCGTGFAHGATRTLSGFESVAYATDPDLCSNHAITVSQSCSNGVITSTPSTYYDCQDLADGGQATGTFIQHQASVINFEGPSTQEDANPSPNLQYRLNVTVRHVASGKEYVVPGFYDGNGNGGGTGNVWRIRFTPELAGRWNFVASFRTGTNVNVSLDPNAGTATSFNGQTGYFVVSNKNASAPGFLKYGTLEHVNDYYLKFKDGPYWIKTGSGDPEDFLGYAGFDNTKPDHDYAAHAAHFNLDPVAGTWATGAGKNILGLLNYFGSVGVNNIYFLPMNIGGDGKNTHPFVKTTNSYTGGNTSNDNTHYDISKLAQWEIVFAHAQRKGIQLHFVLAEGELNNKAELSGGGSMSGFDYLTVERALFYREMVARFGHHQAVQWNISEEYDYPSSSSTTRDPWSADKVLEFAGYIQSVDPMKHPITAHNNLRAQTSYADLLGKPQISSTSLQYTGSDPAGSNAGKGSEVEWFRSHSASAGRKLAIYLDEFKELNSTSMVALRKELLWPSLLSGGAGLEYYMGSTAFDRNDFTDFEDIWLWSSRARKFMEDNLPFHQMAPADSLTSVTGDQVYAKTNEVYAIYFPAASASSNGTINLSAASGSFTARWFNPRDGAFQGSSTTITGGSSTQAIGGAPSADDWVLLIKK